MKKSNQLPSGFRSGWDSAVKAKPIASANKSNAEDDNSAEKYGGMIGDNEDDEVERRSVVNSNKESKPGASNYVRICSIH